MNYFFVNVFSLQGADPPAQPGDRKNQRTCTLEKLVVLLVKSGHDEQLFDILLHHTGFFSDINAVQELPDVLLSDRGGLLDQRRCEGREEKLALYHHNMLIY